MLNLSDDWWFLGQAVHWIAWRDDQFRGGGALPAIDSGSNAALKYLVNSRLKAIDKEWGAAESELFQALVNRELVAYGINSLGRRVPIDAEIWVKAESGNALAPCIVSYGSSGGGDLGGVVQHGREVWEEVHISRDEVTSIWSKPVNEVEPVSADPEGRKRETKPGIIANWLKENYQERPSLQIKELMEIAQQKIPNIGRFEKRTFESALKKAYG